MTNVNRTSLEVFVEASAVIAEVSFESSFYRQPFKR